MNLSFYLNKFYTSYNFNFISYTDFFNNGLYRTIFRYGFSSTFNSFRAVLIYGLIYAVIITLVNITDVPRTIGIIQPILLFFLFQFGVIPSFG